MSHLSRLLLVFLVTLGVSLTAAAEENSTLFGTAEFGKLLAAIDVTTGTATPVGYMGYPQCLSLAIKPDGTAAYSVCKMSSTSSSQLARIDLETGVATLVGQRMRTNLDIMGMTFSPDGVLYAGGNLKTNSLYTINLVTGAPTLVGRFGVDPYLMSFAFDGSGRMFGASIGALYEINPATGAATHVADFVGASMVMGIAFDQYDTLFAANWMPESAGSSVYEIDMSTGDATLVLNTGLAHVHNIAFKPQP
jgi:outer membrane protein assembly factor BamB